MNNHEILLYRILSGYLIFFYKNDRYILKAANYHIKYESQLLYENTINDEKYNDWLREENLDFILINLGLWTKDTQMIIKDIEKKIENSKVDYYNSFKFKDKKQAIKKNLINYENQLRKILIHKDDLYANTLEGYANSLKNEYLITQTLYKNNSLVFNKIDSDHDSYIKFNNIVNELNKYTISIDQFKSLARSSLWRSYWNVNKNNIFDKSAAECTDDQRTLIGISQMYDRVYEHQDCPIDDVIEDDDALEGWMILQRRKHDAEKKKQQVDNINPKLKNAQEVFVMANNQQEAQEVIELNNLEGLNRMRSKISHVNKFGMTEECQLPDVQMDLRNQLNEKNRATRNRK